MINVDHGMVNNIVTTGKSDKNAFSQDMFRHYPSIKVFLRNDVAFAKAMGHDQYSNYTYAVS